MQRGRDKGGGIDTGNKEKERKEMRDGERGGDEIERGR